MPTIPEHERELFKTKWFPYRATSPELCTILFLRDWCQYFNGFHDFHKLDLIANGDGTFQLPNLKWPSFHAILQDHDTIQAVNRQRIFCDKRGIPYHHYWRYAFKIFIDYDKLSNTLVDAIETAGMLGNIVDLFDECRKSSVIMSDSPVLLARNFSKKPYQIEYFRYIFHEVKEKYPMKWKERLYDLAVEGNYLIGIGQPND